MDRRLDVVDRRARSPRAARGRARRAARLARPERDAPAAARSHREGARPGARPRRAGGLSVRILVTSARMPYALPEIRMLGKRGHVMHAADTFSTAPGM